MAGVIAELPVGLDVTQIADQPDIVEESVSEFVETFVEALVIVLVVSFLSLGWRTGIVVALSVPLVLAIVLLVMYAAGIDLHRITLGALIIALGLLVDDAIIAIEMMVVKMEQGWDRARAATYRLDLDGLPHADRHAGDSRRLSAGRLCEIGRGRIRRQHFLDRRAGTASHPGSSRFCSRRISA